MKMFRAGNSATVPLNYRQHISFAPFNKVSIIVDKMIHPKWSMKKPNKQVHEILLLMAYAYQWSFFMLYMHVQLHVSCGHRNAFFSLLCVCKK